MSDKPETVVIKLGQLSGDGEELNEIGAWVIDEPVWGQIGRIFAGPQPASDTPGCVWIDLCDMNGDIISDGPLVIADHHAQWLLRDWFKPPQREWKKIAVAAE